MQVFNKAPDYVNALNLFFEVQKQVEKGVSRCSIRIFFFYVGRGAVCVWCLLFAMGWGCRRTIFRRWFHECAKKRTKFVESTVNELTK